MAKKQKSCWLKVNQISRLKKCSDKMSLGKKSCPHAPVWPHVGHVSNLAAPADVFFFVISWVCLWIPQPCNGQAETVQSVSWGDIYCLCCGEQVSTAHHLQSKSPLTPALYKSGAEGQSGKETLTHRSFRVPAWVPECVGAEAAGTQQADAWDLSRIIAVVFTNLNLGQL